MRVVLAIRQPRRSRRDAGFQKSLSVRASVDRCLQLEDFCSVQQRQKVSAMRKPHSFFASLAALFVAGSLTLIDIQSSSADEALVVLHKRAATAVSSHHRHHWRSGAVAAPVVAIAPDDRLTTALANQYGYNFDPYLGYYGGPVYYGGPYYYRPYFDGASPTYFATHPIVEW